MQPAMKIDVGVSMGVLAPCLKRHTRPSHGGMAQIRALLGIIYAFYLLCTYIVQSGRVVLAVPTFQERVIYAHLLA